MALKNLIQTIFSESAVEILERPHSFIIKSQKESGYVITRIIVLPPHGYTANTRDELNSHYEVRRAKILIKGTLRLGKKGFSSLKNCLKFSYLENRNAFTKVDAPYALISENKRAYKSKILSSKETAYVVKENSKGFYHNLINLTNEPLVLVLNKELRSGKPMDIDKEIRDSELLKNEVEKLKELFKQIQTMGDELFDKKAELIKEVLKLETHKLLPVLIEGLNIYETGRHEPCTVYALILKKAKLDMKETLHLLIAALKDSAAPKYYLDELIKKIDPDPSASTSPAKTR